MILKFKKYNGDISGDFFESYITLGGLEFYLLIAQDEIYDRKGNVIGSYYIINIDDKQIRNRRIKTKKMALRRVQEELLKSCRAIADDVLRLNLAKK
jgi:hypothetical protein